jgi:hypothetical protein
MQANMPVADVNSKVQAIVEQLRQGKRALGQSEQNFLSTQSAVLCGVNGKNLLGVENFEFLRDSAHIYWTPTSTLWDRSFGCISAHGLGKELIAHMHSKGFRGSECESKTGLCFPIENNKGHSMLNNLGMGICCVPSAGDGWGGPQHPQRKLLAMVGALWVLRHVRKVPAWWPWLCPPPPRLLPQPGCYWTAPMRWGPATPDPAMLNRSRTSGWWSTTSTTASLGRERARAWSP